MSKTVKLDDEEREILDAYERGELVSVDGPEQRAAHVKAARETFRKNKRVNIRISGRDLERLQEQALIEGIPYQTLISSVLHKFVNGRLVHSRN